MPYNLKKSNISSNHLSMTNIIKILNGVYFFFAHHLFGNSVYINIFYLHSNLLKNLSVFQLSFISVGKALENP